MRKAEVERKTAETEIRVAVAVDGEGKADIDTGIPFVNHMLTLFAKHGFFDLEVRARGDLEIDAHHTMEDLGIVLGRAFSQALGDKRGIRRYGFFILPMDEALVRVVLDLSGRPYLVYNANSPATHINGLDVRLFHEFFYALSYNLQLNLHIDVLRGEEVHHVHEGIFKAFARALDVATQNEPREHGLPTTKGVLA